MLIRTYGEHWRRNLVNWNRGKHLDGYGRNRSIKGNFWSMRGVYALYQDHQLVYVGQTLNQSLGRRLKQHTKDETRERWNNFSWYGIRGRSKVRDKERFFLLDKLNKAEQPSSKSIVDTLETLVIRIADPDLNRRRQEFKQGKKKAEKFHQMVDKRKAKLTTEYQLKALLFGQEKHTRQLDRTLSRLSRISKRINNLKRQR
jgi:hypothetical protein